jgi:hypothetical protein
VLVTTFVIAARAARLSGRLLVAGEFAPSNGGPGRNALRAEPLTAGAAI